MHPAALPPERLLASCQTRLLRRGGPGGQHRNKVETAVVLAHLPTGVSAEANERRDQSVNRKVALFRLRMNLALAVREPRGHDAAPSAIWRQRCSSAGTIRIRRDHQDFPTLLAEAMDFVAANEDDPRRAAESLGCTATQLARFLKKEPRAFAWLNARRLERGLPPLR